jgi:uncharacterized lipoprotein NlpE involved in copper resistance
MLSTLTTETLQTIIILMAVVIVLLGCMLRSSKHKYKELVRAINKMSLTPLEPMIPGF